MPSGARLLCSLRHLDCETLPEADAPRSPATTILDRERSQLNYARVFSRCQRVTTRQCRQLRRLPATGARAAS
jgi:hypothetical protein